MEARDPREQRPRAVRGLAKWDSTVPSGGFVNGKTSSWFRDGRATGWMGDSGANGDPNHRRRGGGWSQRGKQLRRQVGG